MKDKIEKLLFDNRGGNLADKPFRDMLTMQLLGILGGSRKGSGGATVMTQEASIYNPKIHGPNGPKPQSI